MNVTHRLSSSTGLWCSSDLTGASDVTSINSLHDRDVDKQKDVYHAKV